MSSPMPVYSDDENRFQNLWQRNLVEGAADNSSVINRQLVDAYAEPQRHYHTMKHIEHCLTRFDQCRHQLDTPDAVELAIWFHDVIYQQGACDNEARSAELYLQLSEQAHSAELRDRVYNMIMATLHLGEPIDEAGAGDETATSSMNK